MDGYRWSGRLWKDSFRFDMPAGMEDECDARLGTQQRQLESSNSTSTPRP